MDKVKVYDTTLRDGMQAEGVSFSIEDKVLIARKLDEFGIDYIEGGFPLSNPKEEQFFARMAEVELNNARLVAFGSTRRAGSKVEKDPGIQALPLSQLTVAVAPGNLPWHLGLDKLWIQP